MREVYILMKYKHSQKFYDTRYATYKAEVARIGGFALTKNEFTSGYNALAGSSKNPMKDLVYGSKYGTTYKTAVAEHRALKSVGIKGVKLEDLKLMTTQDFADTYTVELNKAYRELRKKGATGKDAADIISQQWFGSL